MSSPLFVDASLSNIKKCAQNLIDFIDVSPTPFHVVECIKSKLLNKDFKELFLNKSLEVVKNGRYFFTLNDSAIVAFAVGGEYKSGNGISMIGTHTDSPCLKVKPKNCICKDMYHCVGVQTYGGGIWPSWFDRDLTIAGQVSLKNKNGGISTKLMHVKKPIMRIPHLAIHLDRTVNEKFSANAENHICPVIATETICSVLNNTQKTEKYSPLLNIISQTLNCDSSDVLDHDLSVVDFNKPVLGGMNEEFIFSPRLDNLFNTYCAIEGFLKFLDEDNLKNETNIPMVVCYDNEEVGSMSFQGAHTSALTEAIRHIFKSLSGDQLSLHNSFLLSADQAHAIHPNYSDKHEQNHKSNFHNGMIIKYNANQKYATTSFTASVVRLIAEKCKVPVQSFVVRNDSPCGSTIGPIAAAGMGIKTADVGFPMLSMHSIREMCCTTSVYQAITFYQAYFKYLPSVLENSDK